MKQLLILGVLISMTTLYANQSEPIAYGAPAKEVPPAPAEETDDEYIESPDSDEEDDDLIEDEDVILMEEDAPPAPGAINPNP